MAMQTSDKAQLEKFKEAARDLDCDDDDARFNERVAVLVKRGEPPKEPASQYRTTRKPASKPSSS